MDRFHHFGKYLPSFNPRTRVGCDGALSPACDLIGSHAVPNSYK